MCEQARMLTQRNDEACKLKYERYPPLLHNVYISFLYYRYVYALMMTRIKGRHDGCS